MIEATQRRYPAMASTARGVRHRLFDRPLIDRTRDEVATEMRRHVLALAGPGTPLPVDTSHEDALTACTLPLTPVFKAGGLFAETDRPGALLTVLMRRYYKIRDLAPVSISRVDGYEVAASQYRRHDRSVAVLSVRSTTGDVGAALSAVSGVADEVEPPDAAVVDLYLMIPADDHPTPDQLAELIAEQLDRADAGVDDPSRRRRRSAPSSQA